MIRLLLRFLVGIFLAFVLAFAVNQIAFHFIVQKHMKSRPPMPMAGFSFFLKERLKDLGPDKAREELKRLEREIGFKSNLVELAGQPMPPEFKPVEIPLSDKEVLRPPQITSDSNHSGDTPRRPRRGLLDKNIFEPGPPHFFIPINNELAVKIDPPPNLNMFNKQDIFNFFAITIFITGVTAFLLAFPIVRRLKKLEDAAIQISKGDLGARADVRSNDIIGTLASSFNKMADTNQVFIENQRELLQAVAHELRTPMARIRFGMEMLNKTDEQKERERRAREIDKDLEELDDFVDELLLFNRFEDGCPKLTMEDVSVVLTLKKMIKRNINLRNDVEIEFINEITASDIVKASPHSFIRALNNILINAIKYCHGNVKIYTKDIPEGVQIDITDDGPGILPSMREEVFKPFSRVDPSRNKQTGGTGLGLAIVQRIVEAHGASVSILDSEEGGALVRTVWKR